MTTLANRATPVRGDDYVEAMRPQWHDAIKRRMAKIDALSPKMRAVVHEYGWEPVKLLMDLGATNPAQVEHIIRAIRGIGQDREDRVVLTRKNA